MKKKGWKEDVVVYKQEGKYSCFPSLIMKEQDKLITTFRAKTTPSHYPEPGVTKVLMSSDKGRTWTESSIGEYPFDFEHNTSRVFKAKDGALIKVVRGGYRVVTEEEAKELEVKDIPLKPQKDGRILTARNETICYRSIDGGRNWETKNIELPSSIKGGVDFSSIVLADGTLLVAIYFEEKTGKFRCEPKGYAYVLRSVDNGKTWECKCVTQNPPERCGIMEPVLVQAENGDIICMMRTEPQLDAPLGGGYLYQSTSSDEGLTWSEPERTPMWGYPAHLLRLKSGNILCAYGYRNPPIQLVEKPCGMGIRAVISYDNGKSWDVKNEKIIRDDSIALHKRTGYGDLGYPISVQLSDGLIFTIYYITTVDRITHIAGSRYYEEFGIRDKS